VGPKNGLEVLKESEERKVVNKVTPNVCDITKSGSIGNDKVVSSKTIDDDMIPRT
jgi:hypothetical protein